MAKTVAIICDACERDITTSGNSIDWRLALINESIPSRGGFVSDMMIYPAIEKNAYFCGLPCFLDWIKREYNLQEASDEN